MPKGIPNIGTNKGWIKKGQQLALNKHWKVSESALLKYKLRIGSKSANWRGDNVKYRALHAWVHNTNKSLNTYEGSTER